MNDINLPIWKFAFDLVQTAFGVGITIYVWILSKHKANASKIGALEDKIAGQMAHVQTRLTEIETTLEHMPDRESIGKIHKRLDDQARTLHLMEGQLTGINDTTRLILESMIKGDKA